METETREFLFRIATSISVAALWLLINSTVGIGLNLAFFEGRPRLVNYLFYVWFVCSLTGLIVFFRKKWKL